MAKPVVILDPHWRQVPELFSAANLEFLHGAFDVVWGMDEPIPPPVFEEALPRASVLISGAPRVDAGILERAARLQAVIEVAGNFPDTIDYEACRARSVEVLSCAPGFRSTVAEMGLAMALAGARGLVREHESFRAGEERWLDDCAPEDFSLFGARVGFVGFGQIARELVRLLVPFRATVRAYDPWVSEALAQSHGAELCGLDELAGWARCVFVTAAPTTGNAGQVGADTFAGMADHTLVVLLSRAHLVDFDALEAEAASGRLRFAIDVFPGEPLAEDHPLRATHNVVLSPHRAAAVRDGRRLIGEMVCDDLRAMLSGRPERRLARADPDRVEMLAGVGDAGLRA